MTSFEQLAARISSLFSSIYYHCHPAFDIELSHQAVRTLQYVRMAGPVTVQQVAFHLGCAPNTASEILRRLQHKGLICKRRRNDDERVVEVDLTETGHQAVRQHTELHVERLAYALQKMDPNKLQRIEEGLLLLLMAVSEGEKE